MASEKEVSYTTTNTYTTVNTLTSKTKNVWIAFHGLGYLSRYFAKYFKHLNPEENFIIIPQAPSKYYQGSNFKHVGASWLTKENTQAETKNVLKYVDAVWEQEKPDVIPNFIVMGYSQGVSIAARWLASRKIQCDYLLLHSGGIPVELKADDFDYLSSETQVTYLYGDNDPYITEAKKTEEQLKGTALFGNNLKITVFEGVHEVNTAFLQQIATQ
ncbi:esterase [Marixanthomonas sp. SCSIO 43207]|uniref:alpha/beta hydrolase n=1 Tax=Marixanthomonas sp. SCSIO 43207 TaxID=2779360 RepID=UPI001CA7DBC7|nr:esterase [Marixanthomonas sp. SCSIO 43207]UAB80379.1 esterase [Marixanthomonas sp. SCSIO 43207]